MKEKRKSSRLAALHALEDDFQRHCGTRKAGRWRAPHWLRAAWLRTAARRANWRHVRNLLRKPLAKKLALGAGAVVVLIAVMVGAFVGRLMMGPIELGIATPFLESAIKQTIGSSHDVEIGGTQIERDHGRNSIRVRDVIIRDADGAVVAGAPKAEVSVSGTSLLFGKLRVKRLSLVDAELAVRIEPDGQVTISTGAERRPIAVTPSIVKPAEALGQVRTQPQPGAMPIPNAGEHFAAFMGWLDRFAAGGDDPVLGEIGLKDGRLSVDDKRTGKAWSFDNINFSMTRPGKGVLVLRLGSEDDERSWSLVASVTPAGAQRRRVQVEARKVSTKDILLATRLDDVIKADVPISGVIRAEIGADSLPRIIEGRLVAESGTIGDPADKDGSFTLDKAEFTLDWDAARRSMVMPFQILAGANRLTLLSQFEAPLEAGGPWRVAVTGGSIVIGPAQPNESPLVLNRIMLRAKLDPAQRRIVLEQGDISGAGVKLAMGGNLDFSGPELRVAGGLAGTPMSGPVAKKIWPVFMASKVRSWVLENMHGGEITRLELATNAPVDTLREGGPPIPDEGLSVDVTVSNALINAVEGLPPIKDADLVTRIKGRHVQVSVNRGTVEMESGRKLTLTNGLFEIPDTDPKSPPARARFKIEGSMQAAAELLSSEKLKDAASGTPLDPATSRGNVSGQVSVGFPMMRDPPKGATQYNIAIDISNFGAEKLMMGQKVEAQTLKVTANAQGYQIKGDVRVNGTPASLDYRKPRDAAEADVSLRATLDEAARARLGLDAGATLSGPVPVRMSGKIAGDKDARIQVEADLTQARVENLLPGWVKPAGRPNRAVFTLVNKDKATRFEDISIEGSGANVKGSLELDSAGDLVSALFPVFALSDGDKANVRADRGSDGALRVIMRGDLYDGRGFVKSSFGGQSAEQKAKKGFEDLDIDVRLGTVAGHNGETLRGMDLKMTRRAGQIRTFSFASKVGRDTPLTGDLRGGARGRQVLYLETDDAGALFRFTDNYARMQGGQMWVAMDPPTADHAPQEGILNIRDFSVRGEPALDRVVGAQANAQTGVGFSRMRVEFTRTPGKLAIREGVVRGPTIGATMDGQIDFAKSEVRMRGTFVPLYGLNNAFGQIPIVGLFLGGSNEGLLGITYEVVGAPNAPVLRVNPISAAAPGLLRKFFEFPGERQPVEQRPSAYSSPDATR
jgi:hypothetical protein